MSAQRGMTLAECLVALVISSVLLGAVEIGLLAGQRFVRAASASRGVRQNLRAGAAALRGELENLAAASGDLALITDSAAVLRGQRGTGVVCGLPSPGTIVLDDSILSLLRPVNPQTDSVLVFAEGDPLTGTDDRWIAAGVTQVHPGACAGGAGGTALGVSAAASDLAAIAMGAPVRIFEIAEYRRYRDATGTWWLGVRNPSGSGWSATSPIAGPLVPGAGLVLGYLDGGLRVTTIADSVAVVTLQLRMLDPVSLAAPGRGGSSPVSDSVSVTVALGSP